MSAADNFDEQKVVSFVREHMLDDPNYQNPHMFMAGQLSIPVAEDEQDNLTLGSEDIKLFFITNIMPGELKPKYDSFGAAKPSEAVVEEVVSSEPYTDVKDVPDDADQEKIAAKFSTDHKEDSYNEWLKKVLKSGVFNYIGYTPTVLDKFNAPTLATLLRDYRDSGGSDQQVDQLRFEIANTEVEDLIEENKSPAIHAKKVFTRKGERLVTGLTRALNSYYSGRKMKVSVVQRFVKHMEMKQDEVSGKHKNHKKPKEEMMAQSPLEARLTALKHKRAQTMPQQQQHTGSLFRPQKHLERQQQISGRMKKTHDLLKQYSPEKFHPEIQRLGQALGV